MNESMVVFPFLTYVNYFGSVWEYYIYYCIGDSVIMNFVSYISVTDYILRIFVIYYNNSGMSNVKKFVGNKKAGSNLACMI